jgi:voltage-gated potassium channel
VFVVLTARALNPKLRIIARLIEESNREKLKKAGADEVVSPNAIGGMRMASVMIRPSVVNFLDKMLRVSDQTLRVEEVQVNKRQDLIGKSLSQADLALQTGMLLMAIQSADGSYQFNPPLKTVLKQDDILIVMATRDQMETFYKGNS